MQQLGTAAVHLLTMTTTTGGRRRCTAVVLAEVKGVQAFPFGEGAMTVAELIEKF
jgi:hypothetical protein